MTDDCRESLPEKDKFPEPPKKDIFVNIKKISDVTCPILIGHGSEERFIKPIHAEVNIRYRLGLTKFSYCQR